MVELSSLHILLTYQCLFECEHCFVWGSPKQKGVFSLADLEQVYDQASTVPSIRSTYFEGGEPFLYYPLLLAGVRAAAARGLDVGIVTNGYWGTSVDDAVEWLRPMAGALTSISVSTDLLHYDEVVSSEARNILAACEQLKIPVSTITCETPVEATDRPGRGRGEPVEGGAIMLRGRAVTSFADRSPGKPWDSFEECPFEDLADPGRVHLDPIGNLHVCQGLVMGNLFEAPLDRILATYDPEADPVVAALLRGGPAELVRAHDVPHLATYGDACHLCYAAREQLRERFPSTLRPGQMYGDGLT
ncbi:MAG TPA: radical SAM protein [Anaerolineales bacterium]|nr:radical SAM protein [Anaerolineales bacterium]